MQQIDGNGAGRTDRRFVSEVVEIHGYDPDRDEYNYGFIFDSHKELL
jgi:hypothetical protein